LVARARDLTTVSWGGHPAGANWGVGAGVDNGDPTAGLAYDFGAVSDGPNWQLGLVWHEHDTGVDDSWLIGATTQWGN